MYKTKLSEQFVIAIFIILNLWISKAYAQTTGNCVAVDDSDLSYVIRRIKPGAIDNTIEVQMSTTLGVVEPHREDPAGTENYFSFTYHEETEKVLVSTTAAFLNYEKEQNSKMLEASVTLDCTNGRTANMLITFVFDVVNNFAPEFSQPNYEIEIPLPLPIGIDIFAIINQRISAKDYDLSNNEITFTSDIITPFRVDSNPSETDLMGKEFFATILTAAKILNLKNALEFKITATDSGEIPQSAEAIVKVTVESHDEELVEVPIFDKSIYIGTLDFLQEQPLNIEPILLLKDTYIPATSFEIELGGDTYFDFDPTENGIELKLNDDVNAGDLSGQTQLSFVVKATRPDGLSGNVAVLINIIPKKSLVFDNASYKGIITLDTITHDPIKLTDTYDLLDIQFSIIKDDLDWFEIKPDSNANEMFVQLIRPLSDTDLEGKILVSLTIEAKSLGNTVLVGESRLILGIEREDAVIPAFEKSFYEGILSTDLEITHLDELKLADPNIAVIEYTLSNYHDLFEATKTIAGVEIKKKSIVPDDIADKDTLQFAVTAVTDKGITGSTVVILKIERVELVMPVFEKQLYTGHLKRPISSTSLELEEVLIKPHEGDVVFYLSGDDIHLVEILTVDGSGITLGLQGGVTIEDRTVLTVIVNAKLTDALIGTTVVIIHVEQELVTIIQPAFEQNFYHGSLSESHELTMDDSQIKLTQETFSDAITFSKIGVDAAYFSVQQTDNTNNVEISFDPPTNLEDLAGKNILSFSIVATLNGDHIITGTTTVIIELPQAILQPEIIPTFEHNLYVGTLKTDLTIDLTSILITPETHTTDITFALDGFDSDLFKYEETTPGTIEISNDKIITGMLENKQLFKFYVRATNENNNLVGITAVVIEFPGWIVPEFENSLYLGELSMDMVPTFADPIKLTSDSFSSDVRFDVVPGFDGGLFSISRTTIENNVEILTDGITEDMLKSKNVLKIVISATKPDALVGYTVLIINVPAALQGEIIAPEFELPIYHGSLPNEMDEYVITIGITAATITPGITFSLKDGDDSGFFSVSNQNGIQATIMLTLPLEASHIQGKTVLSFTVEAISDVGLRGTTTVIINIPDPSIILPLIFEKSLYVGTLNTDFKLTLQDSIALTDESYSDDVTFDLVNQFDGGLFSISRTTIENNVEILTDGITEDMLKSKNVLKIVISATKPGALVGYTVLIINVPAALQGEIIAPEFELPIYHGSLPNEMDEYVIKIGITAATITPGITFSLKDGDDSGFFSVSDQNGIQATIMLTLPLEASHIQGKTVLSFTVEAISDVGLRGTTTVIINIPDPSIILPLIFEKSLYVGTLNTDFKLTLQDSIALTDESYSDDVTFDLVNQFDGGLFSISRTTIENNVEILTNSITEDMLKSKNVLKIVISATKPGALVGYTVLIINVPAALQGEIIAPEFELPIYHGSLPNEMDEYVIKIGITAATITPGITFSLKDGDDSGFFSVSDQNGIQATIMLTLPLEASHIQGKTVLSFTVEAISDVGLRGTTTVIINIPDPSIILPLIFEKSLYVGTLNTDFKLTMQDSIALTDESYSDDVTFDLVNQFDGGLFSISRTTIENNVEILTDGITEDMLKSKNVLKIVISATKPGALVGYTVLIINVPAALQGEIIAPEFELPIYHGSLPNEMDEYVIKIGITAATITPGITFSLKDGDDSGFFSVSDQNGIQATIMLTLPLEASHIQGKTVLSFTVEAISDVGLRGTTTVIINIPDPSIILPLIFEKSLYVGTLNTDFKLTLQDSIALTDESYSDDVTFDLVNQFDGGLFSISRTTIENNVEILTNSITEDMLKSKNVLKIVISATKPGALVGYTVLIINVPAALQGEIIAPEFELPIYHGSLPNEMDEYVIKIGITAATITPGITFSLKDGDDSGFFSVSDQNGIQATIMLTLPLEASHIQGKTVLSFTVEAISDVGLRGTTTVIINIPDPSIILPLIFEKSLYVGTLNTDFKLTLQDSIALTDESYSDDVTFDLVNQFDGGLFSISRTTIENNVEILTDGITEHMLKSKNVLKIVISATKPGALVGYTVLIINVPAALQGEIIAPEFELPIYHGSLPNEMDEYVIKIGITAATITPGITFSLKDGDDSGFFSVSDQNGIQATIMLTLPLEASHIQGKTVLSFTVEAISDVGLRGTTTVIINIPDPSIILPLIFEKSLYVGTLNTDFKLTLQDSIALTDESYSDDVTFDLVNQFDGGLFSISRTTIENNVEILTNSITEDMLKSKNVLKIVISATKPGALVGYTVLIINVPAALQGEIIAPEFELPIYHGSLPNEMDEYVIKIGITAATITPGITFSLKDGDDSGFFSVSDQNGIQATIMLTLPLEASHIQGKTVLSFTVEAISDVGLRGTTTVIINIPDPSIILPLIFEKSLYVGTLNTDFKLTLQDSIALTDESYSDDVTFDLVNQFDGGLFSISRTTIENNVEILTNSITEDMLKSKNVLKIVISATKPGALVGYTVLIINVPAALQGEIIAPEFELPIYHGSLPNEMDEYVIKIGITAATITPGITFSLKDGDDSGFFSVSDQNGIQATIMLTLPLEASHIQGKTVLSFTVEAISDVGLRGTTTVIINIPDPSIILPLIFEKSLYVGTLNTDFKLTLQDSIALTDESYSDDVTFDLVNQFDGGLFSISRTTIENNVEILTNSITEDMLKSKNVLKIVISATKPGALVGYTVLIINVPAALQGEIIAPEFELPIYHGSLPNEMDEYVIKIGITAATITPGITFSLKDGDDSGFFSVSDQNGIQATIMLTLPLEASHIQGKTVLSFTVEAISDVGLRGTTTVIINIPDPSIILPLIFEKSLYVGTLNTDFKLTLQDSIALTDESYSDDVTFDLVNQFDGGLFSISRTTIENNVEILTNSITEDMLKSKNVLKIVISATKPGALVGYTVLIINVPAALQGEIIAPEFELPIYHGSLPNEMDEYVIKIGITAATITPGITFSLKDGDDSGFFSVSDQNGIQATIMLTLPLEASHIQGKTVLSFTVEAISDVGLRGTTTVIINIPDPSIILPLIFEKSLYVGTLNTDFKLTLQDSIALTDESYSDDVTFDLVNQFDGGLFSISRTTIENNVEILTNSITEDMLKSKNVLKIVISATKPGALVGYTVLIINVPAALQGEIIAPEFELPIYHGSLPNEMDEYVIKIGITAATITPGITFSLKDGDDSGFFSVSDQNGIQATIMLTLPLEASHIQGKTVLSFTVEAISDVGLRGTTTVIINIPDPSIILPLIFEKSLYVGTLNTDFKLTLQDSIALTDESYSDDVTFDLVNQFDGGLFSISRTTIENNVNILTDGITEDMLKSRNVLKIVISATKPGALVGYTVLIINVPETFQCEIIGPEFEVPIYHGSLPNEMDEYVITIGITTATITPGITFSLKDGDDSGFFSVSDQNGIQATIMLTLPLEASHIQGKTVLSFTVEAISDVGLRGTTTVIINIPDPSNILPPLFKKPLYVGTLSTELEFNLEDSIALTDESNLHDAIFLLEQFDSEFFEFTASSENNIISINVKGITEEVIKSRTTLKVIIRAINTQSTLSGITVVIVELKGTSASEKVIPRFEQPVYEGVLSVDLEIEIEAIQIVIETYSKDITVVHSGPDENLFDFSRTDNVISIRTVRELTESDLKDKQVLNIVLSASLPSGEESSTVVLFQIPYEGCRIPNEETKPKFVKDWYELFLEPAKIGVIVTVYAEVPEDTSIEVIYGTQIDDLRLSSKIEIKRETGELSITEIIPPGIYYFIVTARNPKDNSIGSADIKLTITSIIFCSEEPTVSHSLVVKNFEEEQSYSELLNVQIMEPNCQYEIIAVTPISLWDIFTIEGDFLKSESFDRESTIFEEMVVPQITLILEIFCNDATMINGKYMSILHNRTRAVKSTKDDSDDNYYIYTNDIVRDDKKMILSIVIKDINDNSPVFETPDEDILIGYPESQLAEKLLPPHLIKVYATDKDEGINGKIKYSVDSNLHFGINPETGVIYPLKNSMDDILEYNLVVKATDEDGTGLVTSLNIEVKRLEEKHFIVISVENEILDNLDAILLNIETQVGLQVKVLNAVIVSIATKENAIESRSKLSVAPFNNGEQTILRIIGYAFNVNKDPIENTELESVLSELTDVYTISTQNLTDLIGDCEEVPPDNNSCEPTNDDCDECDAIGFIVGLIILALLLLLACIIIFFMWWKWIRPYRYVKRKSSNERLEKDFNDIGYTEPVVAPTATTSDANIFGRANFEIKNESTPAQVTPTSPLSSPASLAKSLHSVLDTENRKESLMLDKDNLSGSSETDDSTTPPPRERKKSIKFNETVERIDILDDVTEKEDTNL